MKLTVKACLAISIIANGSAWAQGTSPNGIRNGYGGVTPSPPSSSGTTGGSTSNASAASRNPAGTNQGRSEGALGLTPQLQKELGISRQQ
jgi:hypothetical protein